MCAAKTEEADCCIRLLLSKGADINARAKARMPFFFTPCSLASSVACVFQTSERRLSAASHSRTCSCRSPRCRRQDGATALMLAADDGLTTNLRALLNTSGTPADVNAADEARPGGSTIHALTVSVIVSVSTGLPALCCFRLGRRTAILIASLHLFWHNILCRKGGRPSDAA